MNPPGIKLRAVKAAVFLAVLLLALGHAARAVNNTPVTIVLTGTDLSLGATYSPSGVPTSGTDDVEFVGSFTGGTTFNVNGASLAYGTLDDEDASQALTILNNNATGATITLSNANNNEATGAAAADLLYVASGGNLTIGNGAGNLQVTLGKTGNIDNAGTLVLSGSLNLGTYTATFDGAGTTTVSGNIANTSGAITIGNTTGGVVIFSGSNSSTGAITISSGATLQLQANSGNTVSGTSYALTNSSTANTDNGGTIQLRGNSSTVFNGFNNLAGIFSGSAVTTTFDVNNNGSGTGNTLSIAPAGFTVGTTDTINATGGNGYILAIGTLTGAVSSSTLTLVPISASMNIGGFNTSVSSYTYDLDGEMTGNVVSGAILGASGNATAIKKSNISTWTLSGTGNYTGATTVSGGTLILGASNAITASAVTVSSASSATPATLKETTTNALAGTSSLTVTAGSAILSASNNFTGATAVNGGTLQLQNAGSIGSSALTLSSGILQLRGDTGGTTFLDTSTTVSGNATIDVDKLSTGSAYTTLNLGNIAIGANTLTFTNNNGATDYNLTLGTVTATAGPTFTNSMVSGTTTITALTSTATASGTATFNDTNASGTTVVGAITQNGANVLGLTYSGSGTLLLNAANTYAGTTTVGGGGTLQIGNGSAGSLHGTTGTPLTFNGQGTVNFDEASAVSQGMTGALTFSAGEGTVESSNNGGTSTVTFGSLAAHVVGATGNFVLNGGTPGTPGGGATAGSLGTNNIAFTTTPSAGTGALLSPGLFYNGSSYAAYDAGGFIRAYNSGDANYLAQAASTSGVSGASSTSNVVFTTGNVSGQTGALTINTLNMGAYTFALTSGTLSTAGILSSGNNAATLSGGALQAATAGGELIVNVNQPSNVLTVTSTLQDNSSASSLTKAGAGALIINTSATYTGNTYINEGTLQFGNGTAITLDGNTYASSIVDNGSLVFDSTSGNTLKGNISGAGSVTEEGTGVLSLQGPATNTFTGGLNILAGQVTLVNSSAMGPSAINLGAPSGSSNAQFTFNTGGNDTALTNPVNVIAGSTGTLSINATSGSPNFNSLLTLGNNLSLQDTNSSGGAALIFNGGVVGAGNISVNDTNIAPTTFSGGALSFTGTISNLSTSSGAVTVSANMTGAESLIQNSSGSTMTVSGNNTNTGTTTATQGTLEFTQENALYNYNRSGQWTTSNIIVQPGGTLAFEVGNTGGFTTADLTNLMAISSATGGFENGANIGIDTTGASLVLANNYVIANTTAGALGLSVLGAHTLELQNAATYTGPTTIGSSATLQLGAGTAGNNASLASTSIANAGTLLFEPSAGVTDTYNGNIGGSGAVTVNGNATGTVDLGGINISTGTVTVSAGTLDLTSQSALQDNSLAALVGSLTFDSSVTSKAFTIGALGTNANPALTLNNTAGAGITLTLGGLAQVEASLGGTSFASSGVLSGLGGLTFFGYNNTLTLAAAELYSGATTILGGTINLGNAGANGSINSASALVLGGSGGGTLAYTRTGTVSQAFASTTVNEGENFITESTATQTLNLGLITNNVGGTLDLTPTGASVFNASNTDVNGILGGWATYSGRSTWATDIGGVIGGLANGSYTETASAGTTPSNYLNQNIDVNASETPTGAINPNSIRFNTAAAYTLTLTGVNVISSGGILVTPTVAGNASAITGGYLLGTPGGQLSIIVNNTSSGLTIGSLIEDNGSPTAVAFSSSNNSSSSDYLYLTNANNSFSGGYYVNGGRVGSGSTTFSSTGGTEFGTGNVIFGDQVYNNSGGGTVSFAGSEYLTSGLLVDAYGAVNSNGQITNNSGGTSVWTLEGAPTATATFNGQVALYATTRIINFALNSGTQIFGGTDAGSTLITVNGGTFQLGNGYSGNLTNGTGNEGVALGGGTFLYYGNYAGTSSQSLPAGLTVNSGASTLTVSSNGNAGTLLSLTGAITRSTGGTVNFNLPAAEGGAQGAINGITTTNLNTNGILGGYATVGGTDWASNNTNVSGGNIVGLSTSASGGGYTVSNGGAFAPGTTANVDFQASNSTAATQSINSLRFNTAAANTLTLNSASILTDVSGGILVTPNVGANVSTITSGTLEGAPSADLVVIQNNTSAGLTIGSVIANNTGATALTKSGAGLLTLTGINTFTGGLYLNGGIVNTGSSGIATASSIVFNGGGLQLTNAYTTSNGVTMGINGGTIDTQGNNVTLSGAVTNVAGNQFVGAGALGGFVNTGVGALTKAGSGQLTLSSASNAFGGGIIISSGTVQDGNAASTTLGTGYLTFVNNGNTPTLDLDGHSATVAGLIGAGSNGLLTNSVASTTGTLTLDGVYGETFGGVIQNGLGTAALTENLNNATETVTLLGNDTYTGATTVTSGNLQIGNGTVGSLSSSPLTVAANMTVGFDEANNSTSSGTISNSGAIVGDEGSGITNTLGGVISGGGSLTQTGSGTTILSGSNTYTGSTTVNAGTLQIGNGVGGSIAANVTVAGGAALAFNQAANNSTYAGNVADSGTVVGAEATVAQTNTLSGVISGTGGFTQSGAGSTLLSNVETYTGPTSVSAGTLALSGSLGNTAVTIQNGGTFLAKNSVAIGTSVSGAATLTIAGGGTFSLANNAISTVTLNTTSGTALTIGGASSAGILSFDLGDNTGASELLVSGNGTASVLAGGGAITVNALAGSTALTSSTFTLISDANGGLTGSFSIAGSPYVSFGANSYYLTLSDSNTGVSLVASLVTAASTAYWTGATNLSWSQLSNFTSDAGGTTALTNASPITGITDVFLTANSNVVQATPENLDTSTTVNSLTFTGGATAGAGGIVLNTGTAGSILKIKAGTANTYAAGVGLVVQSGGAGNVINANVQLGNPQTWEILSSAANALTVNGVISDNSLGYALTVTGPGELTLAGANTFGGGLILSSGTLAINNGAALGGGAFTIDGGAAIDNTSGAPLTITNNNLENWNGNFTFVGSNALNLGNGAVTMSGSTQVTVLASTLTVGGVIGGSGDQLALAGNGTLVLGGANTYSGNTTITSGATLTLANALALQNSTLDFSNGSLSFSNLTAATFGGLIGTNTAQTLALTNTASAAVAVTVGGNGSSGTYSGSLSGLGSVIKTGAGLLTLAGNDSYAGSTAVSAGELDLSGSNSGAGGVTLTSGTLGVNSAYALGASGGTLTINGGVLRNTSGSAVTNAVANPVTIGGSFAYSTAAGTASNNLNLGNGAVTLGSSGLTITLNGAGTLAFGGALSNNATGANTLTVNNGSSNTTFGSLSFGGWALSANATNVIDILNGSGSVNFTGAVTNGNSTASGLTYAGTGMLTLSSVSNTYSGATAVSGGTLSLTGALLNTSGVATSSSGVFSEASSGSIGGSATFTQGGTGSSTLAGSNSYTGATTINGGTLTFEGANAIPSTTAINFGGSGTTLNVYNDGTGSNGTIALGNNVTATNNGTGTYAINVGDYTSSNTGNTFAFGVLSTGPATQGQTGTFNITGANGDLVSFTSLALPGVGGQSTYVNPTTTSVSIGNVTNQITSTGATHYDTLVLEGSSTGNIITGTISDSPVYTAVNAGDTRITMQGTGAWTLAGQGNYHGATSITSGTLNLTGTLNNTVSVTTSVTGNFAESSGGSITGAATFTQGSTGTSTLAGVNTYTGATTISGGTLNLNSALSTTPSITTSGAGILVENSAGSISGATTVTQGSTGISTLAGVNTYTGATTISGGTLEFLNETSLYDDVTSNWTASKIIVQSGGTLAVTVNGAGEFTTSDINTLLGISTSTGGFESGAAIGIDTTAGSYTWSGVLANTYYNNDSLGLEKLGPNTLTLTAADTYTGSTTILGGTIDLDNQYAAQYSLVNLNGGSLTFDAAVSGNAFTIGGLTGSGNLALQNTGATAIALTFGNGGGANSGSTATNGTYTGVLSGGGSLTKIGDNTEILSGASTYTGPTTINAGTLELNFAQSGAPSTNILYNGVTAGALTIGGVASSTQTLNNPNITLNVASASTGNQSQTFASLTLNTGYDTISTTDNGTGNVLVTLNGITQNTGSVLNVNAAGTASATNAVTTTNSNDATGILGGWAVVGGGTGYATVNGSGQIVAYAGYDNIGTGTTITDDGGTTTNANVEMQPSSGATVTLSGATNGATNINTLFYNAANSASVSLTSGTLRLGANGGILDNAAGKTFTISGGTLTAGGSTLNTAGTLSIIDTSANNNAISISSVIANNNTSTGAANSSGAGVVTLTIAGGSYGNGNNSVTLSGANTYSGGTYLDGGRIVSTNVASFGTGQVTVMPGAQAFLDVAGTYANAFNIAGIGQGEGGYASAIRFVVGNITLSGQVTLLGDAAIQNQGGTDTISGGITGNYNLNLFGSSGDVTILSGATTIGGNLGINAFIPGVSFGGGTNFTVEVTNAAGLDSGSSTGNVIMNGSTGGLILDIHGVSTSINGLVGIGLNASQTEVTNLAASGNNATLTLGNNNATATYGGNIVQTTGDGTLAIVKTGSGTQVLAGSGDTFTGGLTINQGTIQDANSNSGVLGAGSVTFGASNTPTLDLDGNSATTGLLAGAGANGIITDSAASTTSTLTLTGAGSQTFGGSIQNGSGTVALTLVSGTQTLTGANTYTGATTVYYPGVLNIGGGGSTGSINSGSALVLNGGSLAFNETGSPTQTFAGTTIGSALAGTGALGNSNVTSASGDTLVLGALTRATGSGGVNFGGAGVIDTTTANQAGTGILGGYATFSGSTWAVSAGTGSVEGQITGLASSAYTLTSTAGSVAANYAGGNIDVNSSPDLAGAISASSVRFNTAAPETFSLTGTNVFAAGAMLVTSNVGSNTSTITGGTIEGGGGEFVINQENTAGGLNIFSAIADDGVPTALTLDGGGSVTLFGANTYTGATAISGGGLTLDGGSLGSTAVTINAGTFTDNGSTGSGGSLAINSGATLAGVGAVGGNVTLNPGGIINFGDGGAINGTLAITGAANWNGLGAVNGATTVSSNGSLTIGSGAIMTAPGGVTVNGALNLTGELAGSLVANSTFNQSSGVIAGSASSVTLSGGVTDEILGSNTFGGGLFLNNVSIYDDPSSQNISPNIFGSGNITFSTSNSPTINLRVNNGQYVNTGLLVGAGNNGIIEETDASNEEAYFNLFGTGSATYNGQINQGSGISTRDIGLVLESGAQILGGTSLAGLANITVNNGTFQLGNGTSGSPTLDTTAPNAIAVAGGTFILESQNNSTQYTASVGNLSVNSGGSTIQDNNLGTGGDLLTLGSITRAIGGTVNFILPTGAVSSTNGITTTTVNTAAGIIGGYATVGGTDWAINSTNASGGNIAGLSSGAGYTASTAGTTTPGVTTSNIDFQNSNTNSWNSSTVNSLRFNSTTSGTLSITAANTLTVTSGGILVTANVGSNATGISGGSITSSGTDLIIIQNNTSAGFTISSLITATGADGLTKSGAGLLTLNPGSANTFTGAITLNGGILNTTQNGIGSAGSFVFNGGTLQANGAISTSKAITLNYAGGGGTFDTNGASSTFSGAISGGGGLTVIGSGTATLSYATGNTFTGGLTINNTATVVDTVNHTGQLGAGVLTFGANGTLDLSTGAGPTVAGLSATNSGALITNITNNTSTITLNGASNYSYAGAINNGDGGLGVIALTVNLNNPTQVQTLSSADTYTGATTITQGSLDLSNALAVQDSTVTLNGGGLIFDQSVTASSNAFTLGGLAGSAALALQNNASTPAAVSVSVGNNNANTTYSGILTGPGSLTKIGTGSLTLSGGAFYTGATSVNSGTLALTGTLVGTTSIATSGAGSFTEGSAGIIAGAAGFTQGSSATSTLGGVNLYTGATSATNGTLSLTGMLNGTPSVTTSAAGAFSETSTGTIAGAGTTFSQGSSATSTLGGVNSYTGATSVSAGTLNLTGMLNGTPSVTTSGAGAFTESSTGVIAGAATTFTQGSSATSTLGGVNTYTGATFINAGVLDLATASSISTGNITFGGGTLQYGQGTNSQDYSSQIVNSTGAISVDTNDNSITWSSSLASSNTGGLTVMDSSGLGGFGGNSGNLTLNAVDNYGGATTVEGGAYLADGVSGGLPSGTVLNIGGTVNGYSGGTFDIDGNNQTVSGLVSLGNGSSDLLTNNGGGNAVLTISGVGGTYAGQIQDGSSYIGIALASGTETLSGNASSLSYSNGTTVSGGTLIVSGSLSGGGAVNVTGGTLEVDGSVNNALTINVGSGGTLEGTGSVGGISTSGAGSSFDPGLSAANSTTSTGTLIANGNVTLDPTAFNIRLGLSASGTDSDELVEGGSGRVNLENSTLNLTLGSGMANLTSANIDNLYYVIINGGSQTVLGTFNGDPNGTIVSATSGGNTWQFEVLYNVNANGTTAGDDVVLELTAVPEPGTWAMMLAGMGMLIVLKRRRRRA